MQEQEITNPQLKKEQTEREGLARLRTAVLGDLTLIGC